MPLQRRLPKYGFRARKSRYAASVPLKDLNRVSGTVVSIETLKKAGIIGKHIRQVKVFLSGEIKKAMTIEAISATAGARGQIIAKGGKITEAKGDDSSRQRKKPVKKKSAGEIKQKPTKKNGKEESE